LNGNFLGHLPDFGKKEPSIWGTRMRALQISFCSRPKLQADLNPRLKTMEFERMAFVRFVDRKEGFIFRDMFAFVCLADRSDVNSRFFGTSQATLNLHLMSSFSIVLVLFLLPKLLLLP
jgi:hypothetical protein